MDLRLDSIDIAARVGTKISTKISTKELIPVLMMKLPEWIGKFGKTLSLSWYETIPVFQGKRLQKKRVIRHVKSNAPLTS